MREVPLGQATSTGNILSFPNDGRQKKLEAHPVRAGYSLKQGMPTTSASLVWSKRITTNSAQQWVSMASHAVVTEQKWEEFGVAS